ncbi:MAG: DUF2007 domain-containing protein [Chromatiaceae bacterium]|nr:DUF2007 domain-containing protein [Gammaproteobacteria bacterium]MCP5305258.1 DUF2007 domain-containing protein [Chromatiaceae bacterium]MCP5315217.1 DUF2007 domain-containing protein [Chromatiaceae bacterium]
MLKFYEARDSLEARQLVDALTAYHIEATVLGEYLSGAAGHLPAINYPWVWLINNEDLAVAQRVLDGFLASRGDLPKLGPWVCQTCGAEVDAGFDICWQCGAARK